MDSAFDSRGLLNEFCSEIIVFSNQIKKAALNSSRAQSVLSVGQAVLELVEERGPMTVPGIAAERSSSRQNVQIMVNRLARFGLVEVVTNPNHKRSSLVAITAKGQAELQHFPAQWDPKLGIHVT